MFELQNNKIFIDNAGYYHCVYKHTSIQRLHDIGNMHGPRRVAVFCLLTAVLPTILIIIPLYLRHSVFADVHYNVTDSDVFEIEEGMSSVFCQEHTLEMNTSFHAYQLSGLPEISNRKHIRLKKSMSLPDDTLEYWGFYLLKGATVNLKVCSRHEGSKILVVRGEKNLRTCGLLEHNVNKPHLDKDHKQVKVTFETAAQEIIDSSEKIEVSITSNKKKENPIAPDPIDPDTAAEDDSEDIKELTANEKIEVSITSNKKKENPIAPDPIDPGTVAEDESEDIKELTANVEKYLSKRLKSNVEIKEHHKRHAKKREHEEQVLQLQQELNEDFNHRRKRETGHKLDGAIEHGGNAINYTYVPSGESDSVSSFENNLLECYDGQILLTQSFPPSELCNDVHYLARGDHMQMTHEVSSDGYYYYIFYSDNDLIRNDIHGVFDIYKPTFQYANVSDTKQCINNTQCNFFVSFFSDEVVIVEVPTRDGIEHEDDDTTVLVSKCKPRMAIYIIFPVAILFLILGCAFL